MASQVLRNPDAPRQPELNSGDRAIIRDNGAGTERDYTGHGSGKMVNSMAKGLMAGSGASTKSATSMSIGSGLEKQTGGKNETVTTSGAGAKSARKGGKYS